MNKKVQTNVQICRVGRSQNMFSNVAGYCLDLSHVGSCLILASLTTVQYM
ncbi:hypothetical protein EXN66_Car018258 [Channa argus]|uniref:Uncharacterized protein n=1 Tax=Channa argus TaxID=215402 RepID=A0A6G1QIP6_CHAAH|nr:hypothetical protein EXN66_Car018258 [Channa argus]